MPIDCDELRKAAVLIASLDAVTAESLLADLAEDQVERIRTLTSQLDALSPREREQIVADFLNQAQSAGSSASDVPVLEGESQVAPDEYRVMSQFISLNKHAAIPDSSNARRLNRLLDDDGHHTIHDLLKDEQPQTIAMIITTLTPTHGAKLLESYSPEQQSSIIDRLAKIERIDASIVEDVTEELVHRLDEHLRHPSPVAQGRQVLAALCDVVRGEQRQKISQHLRASLNSECSSADQGNDDHQQLHEWLT